MIGYCASGRVSERKVAVGGREERTCATCVDAIGGGGTELPNSVCGGKMGCCGDGKSDVVEIGAEGRGCSLSGTGTGGRATGLGFDDA